MSHDPLFGDTRIEIEELPRADSPPPPPGPPSRQKIHLVDEDLTVRFQGHEIIPYRRFLWNLSVFLTLGVLGLVGHWFLRFWLRWVTREKAFKDIKEGFVVVEVNYPDPCYIFGLLTSILDSSARYRPCPLDATSLSIPALDRFP